MKHIDAIRLPRARGVHAPRRFKVGAEEGVPKRVLLLAPRRSPLHRVE